eukprot:TRINITY_DN7921_c0_g1_i2.p1 TRINITY_DN7921_c0_g1~~TRINITY_DN7921_c0_g1_i2.p1  ORF type:complete len:376 (-),score=54.84 TRINITY_DN7921_c0_g1_i2:1049-2176(-)
MNVGGRRRPRVDWTALERLKSQFVQEPSLANMAKLKAMTNVFNGDDAQEFLNRTLSQQFEAEFVGRSLIAEPPKKPKRQEKTEIVKLQAAVRAHRAKTPDPQAKILLEQKRCDSFLRVRGEENRGRLLSRCRDPRLFMKIKRCVNYWTLTPNASPRSKVEQVTPRMTPQVTPQHSPQQSPKGGRSLEPSPRNSRATLALRASPRSPLAEGRKRTDITLVTQHNHSETTSLAPTSYRSRRPPPSYRQHTGHHPSSNSITMAQPLAQERTECIQILRECQKNKAEIALSSLILASEVRQNTWLVEEQQKKNDVVGDMGPVEPNILPLLYLARVHERAFAENNGEKGTGGVGHAPLLRTRQDWIKLRLAALRRRTEIK